MVTMLAFLQSSGTLPECSGFWNTLVNAGASSSPEDLKIIIGFGLLLGLAAL